MKFGANLLTVFLQKTGNIFRNQNSNFMIAPFSIWSLMLLLVEGATDETLEQLQIALDIPRNLTELRRIYGNVHHILETRNADIEFDVNQGLVYDVNRPVLPAYGQIIQNHYKADLLPTDFRDTQNASKLINEHIRVRTHDKIRKFLEPVDLTDVQLLLTSVNFFKGKWKVR